MLLEQRKEQMPKFQAQVDAAIVEVESQEGAFKAASRDLDKCDEDRIPLAKAFEEKQSELENKQSAVLDHQRKFTEYQSAVNSISLDIAKQEKTIAALRSKMENLQEPPEIAKKKGQIEILMGRLQELKDENQGAKDEMAVAVKEKRLADYWIVAFKDIRFAQFEKVVEVFEKLLNHYCLQQGLKFDKVIVTKTRAKQDRSVIPEINTYVERDGHQLHLSAMSEGESARMNIACFFSISSLIEQHTGYPIDLRVLDEPFSGIDHEGKELAFNMLVEVGKDKQVIVVDHDALFKQRFESVLVVEKTDGVSRIAKDGV